MELLEWEIEMTIQPGTHKCWFCGIQRENPAVVIKGGTYKRIICRKCFHGKLGFPEKVKTIDDYTHYKGMREQSQQGRVSLDVEIERVREKYGGNYGD